MRFDPIRLEVFQHLLAAVCDECGALLQRSAISPNIRERRDFSVALFDGAARLLAQAAHIPVHLGSAKDSVLATLAAHDLEPGDVVVLNDPFAGGTHLPDVTVVRPVFVGGRARPSFFLVNRAHHADIGGGVPGSMGIAADLLGEGLVIPPVKLRARGELQRDVVAILRKNVRAADERMIDFSAQEASLELGQRRLLALVAAHGLREVETQGRALIGYTARLARAAIARLPRGRFSAADSLEGDGYSSALLTIRLALTVARGKLRFDFHGTSRATKGPVNANRSIVMAACVYALRCLIDGRVPTNEGLFEAVEIVTEPGSLVEPPPGSAVAGGNVETSQRLVDVCFKALARAAPERIPAASAGTMSNVSLGGTLERGQAFTFYETLPGGAGASAVGPGCSAVQTHMTNTRNTPVEAMELCWPVRVVRLDVERGSGGRGKNRGGDGIVKEYEVLVPATFSLLAERHARGPFGLAGGSAGRRGTAALVRRGRAARLPAKGSHSLLAGDRVRVTTPGGGGYG